MEKINIAELLRNCPSGMELDCYLFDGLEFDHIDNDNENYPIVCRAKSSQGNYNIHTFNKYGWFTAFFDYAKCVIFPKGKTTWEGFVPPCKFKDGDVVYIKTKGHNHNEFIIIFKEIKNDHIHKHACFAYQVLYTCKNAVCHLVDVEIMRLATEEEKAKLFDAIKSNGYKWNTETKNLEKLIQPKFKVGDRITNGKTSITIGYIDDEYYYEIGRSIATRLLIKNQDEWKLVPNKFDITTLVPFESRVLARDNDKEKWHPGIWGFYDENSYNSYPYKLIGDISRYCIPYEGNEHLLGKTYDCDEYFKTWK